MGGLIFKNNINLIPTWWDRNIMGNASTPTNR